MDHNAREIFTGHGDHRELAFEIEYRIVSLCCLAFSVYFPVRIEGLSFLH